MKRILALIALLLVSPAAFAQTSAIMPGAIWFLVLHNSVGYINSDRLGPLTEESCRAMEDPSKGIFCRRMVGGKLCTVDGIVGSAQPYGLCPILEGDLGIATGHIE